MKKSGIINRDLSRELAKLGHTQTVVIADCGLPCPAGVPVVDVSVVFGVPGFVEVAEAVIAEIVVEQAWAAEEVEVANPAVNGFLVASLPALDYVSHENFKAILPKASVIIRTGEATPYANVVLQCGVPF